MDQDDSYNDDNDDSVNNNDDKYDHNDKLKMKIHVAQHQREAV